LASRIPPRCQSATVAAGGRIGEIVREEECAHGGIGQDDPIVIELTSKLGIKNQVAVWCGSDTGRVGVNRSQFKTRLARLVGLTWLASRQ
jgi:hypothetical protein